MRFFIGDLKEKPRNQSKGKGLSIISNLRILSKEMVKLTWLIILSNVRFFIAFVSIKICIASCIIQIGLAFTDFLHVGKTYNEIIKGIHLQKWYSILLHVRFFIQGNDQLKHGRA